jgi:hypothetical protein
MSFFGNYTFFAIGLPHWSDAGWFVFLFVLFLCPVLLASALISCVRNESSTGNMKVIWVIIILLLHFVGPLAYFLIRRPQRIRELGR